VPGPARGGYEVFSSADRQRHESDSSRTRKRPTFYLFGILAAEAYEAVISAQTAPPAPQHVGAAGLSAESVITGPFAAIGRVIAAYLTGAHVTGPAVIMHPAGKADSVAAKYQHDH